MGAKNIEFRRIRIASQKGQEEFATIIGGDTFRDSEFIGDYVPKVSDGRDWRSAGIACYVRERCVDLGEFILVLPDKEIFSKAS